MQLFLLPLWFYLSRNRNWHPPYLKHYRTSSAHKSTSIWYQTRYLKRGAIVTPHQGWQLAHRWCREGRPQLKLSPLR